MSALPSPTPTHTQLGAGNAATLNLGWHLQHGARWLPRVRQWGIQTVFPLLSMPAIVSSCPWPASRSP